MTAYQFPEREFQRIFGTPEREERPGAYRKCKTCGGWHARGRVPHNCRPEAPPRADYATPQIAAPFQPFMTGRMEGAAYIGNRADKREYMKRNDLVEYDEGVNKRNDWVEAYERDASIVESIERAMELDPAEREPLEYVGQRDLGGAGDIDTDHMDIIE